MSISQSLLENEVPDITISTAGQDQVIISQPIATEPTNITVAITQTTIDTDGRTVLSVRTDTVEVTIGEFKLQQQVQNYQLLVSGEPAGTTTVPVTRRFTKEIDGGYVSRTGIGYNYHYQFEAAKLGGTITSSGGRQQRASSTPQLQRYNYTTKQWDKVVDASRVDEHVFTISHTYPPVDIAAPRPLFRIQQGVVAKSGGGKDSYMDSVSYRTSTTNYNYSETGSETITLPDTSGYEARSQTIYKVVPNPDGTVTNTETRAVNLGTSTEERVTRTTSSLFNPKPSVLMTVQGGFILPESLNTPVIDLFSYIQEDINS